VSEPVRLVLPWTALASSNERNSRRGGKAHSYTYKASREAIYLHALDQVRGERPVFKEGPVEVKLRFYPPTWRGDATNFLKVLLDSVQGVLYANDSQVRSLSHLVVDVDEDRPRCEMAVERWTIQEGR
jgi:Holliday junction resolvase RusA-like endonuclease